MFAVFQNSQQIICSRYLIYTLICQSYFLRLSYRKIAQCLPAP
nr:MAG TPA: hypothetical protein [Caudoviricetes sp.]